MLNRILLTIGISTAALLISILLDRLFEPLSPLLQFFIQVPVLVLIMDELRRVAIRMAPAYQLTESDVNGTFFFASPLAAFGAKTLFSDIQKMIHRM